MQYSTTQYKAIYPNHKTNNSEKSLSSKKSPPLPDCDSTDRESLGPTTKRPNDAETSSAANRPVHHFLKVGCLVLFTSEPPSERVSKLPRWEDNDPEPFQECSETLVAPQTVFDIYLIVRTIRNRLGPCDYVLPSLNDVWRSLSLSSEKSSPLLTGNPSAQQLNAQTMQKLARPLNGRCIIS